MPLELEAVCQETGLVWPAMPSWEEWADLGPRIASVNNVSRWALADWLCAGEDLFQAKADQVVAGLGLSYHALENLRWVARKVPLWVRQPLPVSFSHHALVAALSPVAQQGLLSFCAEQQWTRDEFREHLIQCGLLEARSPREDWRQEAVERLDKLVADLLLLVEKLRR